MVRNKQNKSSFNNFYKSYWFIIWFFIYGILLYLSTILSDILGINNYYFKIIFIGILISIIARAISFNIHHYTFKLNFNLLIWIIVYILLLFGINWLLSYFTINLWLNLVISAVILLISVHLIKKIPFKTLAIISIIISLIFAGLLFFNVKELNLSRLTYAGSYLSNNPDLNDISMTDKENLICTSMVYPILGSSYSIVYLTGTSQGLNITNVGFGGIKEGLLEFEPIFKAGDKVKLIQNNLRLGTNTGENKNKLYGSLIYRYSYSRQVIGSDGIIEGTNSFEIEVNIPDISVYTPTRMSGATNFFVITMPTEAITKINKCGILE